MKSKTIKISMIGFPIWKRLFLLFVFFLPFLSAFLHAQKNSSVDLTAYVNPFIGTLGGGGQNPGARYPFGMTHFGPDNKGKRPNEASIYQFGNPEIYGFNIVQLSGSPCAGLGGMAIMPAFDNDNPADLHKKYSAETAKPGSYSVVLDGQIKTELSASARGGMAKLTYPAGKNPQIVVDLSSFAAGQNEFFLQFVSPTELEGFRTDGQFCGKEGQHDLYFVIRFSQVASSQKIIVDGKPINEKRLRADQGTIKATAEFSDPELLVRIGISYLSIDNARLNLNAELGEKTFDAVRDAAAAAWRERLQVVQVEGEREEDKVKFYTALYHTMSQPNILQDVNGEYPAMEKETVAKAGKGRNRYSNLFLPNTYRTLHPLFCLLYPEVQSDIIHSLLAMRRESGWLPQWELIGKEKAAQNGDPAAIVINDTYQRGIHDFDVEIAYNALLNNARNVYTVGKTVYVRKASSEYFNNIGYITQNAKSPGQEVWGSVSTTQEYNLADWNIAQLAKSLNKPLEQTFLQRASQGHRMLFDLETRFFRPRMANGGFMNPFNPLAQTGETGASGSGGPGFVNGNAWQYRFFVPHDQPGLVELMGGARPFADTLQRFFDRQQFSFATPADWAYPFLFNDVKGDEWRAQEIVRQLVSSAFSIKPDGLPASDQSGGLSAWLVYAMLGLYPDCPGKPTYQIGIPAFSKITIQLHPKYYEGKTLVIETKGNKGSNLFVREARWDGKKLDGFSVNHEALGKGGKLILTLGKNE
jgi:predicted alpha-1,2-mannosidase